MSGSGSVALKSWEHMIKKDLRKRKLHNNYKKIEINPMLLKWDFKKAIKHAYEHKIYLEININFLWGTNLNLSLSILVLSVH